MTRGFVTVATGKDSYYQQALNLLHSFRLHNPDSRFAILCDKENNITKEFDDVVVLSDAKCNYQDKFRLLTDCPYDENIFIETDCLVYRNIDFFWDKLAVEWDFSCFGWNNGQVSIWFENELCVSQIEQLFNREIKTIPIFNPGYLFIRKSEKTVKMYSDIVLIESYLYDNWKGDKNLFVKGNLRDDPLFCLAMELNSMRCAEKPSTGKCIFVPSKYQCKKVDLISGKLDVIDKDGKEYNNCSLLHFSSRKASEEGLYPWQVSILNAKIHQNSEIYIKFLSSRFVHFTFNIGRYVSTRLKRIIRRIHNK